MVIWVKNNPRLAFYLVKYRPRQPETRLCAHCHTPYSSAHKRRIYCGNSCANLASYARRPQSKDPKKT